MKKTIITLILLTSLLVMASCQQAYDTPQTVEWTDDTFDIDVVWVSTEVSVILLGADKLNPSNYSVIGSAISEMLVDIEAAGLPPGGYVVAIRYRVSVDGVEEWDPYAYSDVLEDVDPVIGEFYIRLLRDRKPLLIRIR